MSKVNTTPFETVLDEFYGKEGSPRRDDFDRRVSEAVYTARIGESIKAERIRQNLTQDELGERIGVKKAQISRLERGYSTSLPTICRVFQALGVTSAILDLGSAGKVALW